MNVLEYSRCGVRIHELPASPKKVKEGLDAIAEGREPYAPEKYFLGEDLYEQLNELKRHPLAHDHTRWQYFNPLGPSKTRFV